MIKIPEATTLEMLWYGHPKNLAKNSNTAKHNN